MRYGIAIWNFVEPHLSLPELMADFAGFGFDTISFTYRQLTGLPRAEAQVVAQALRDLGLKAALHANFDLTGDDARLLVDLLGPDLLTFTLDAAMAEDSRGRLFDASRMAKLLLELAAILEPTPTRFGVEDFPLDALAVDYYRTALAPVLEQPHYGMLIDLGHLNMRLTAQSYFRDQGLAEYFRRLPLPVLEVHVHDNRGDRDAHAGLGHGTGDFAGMAAGLRARGFDGISTIEIAPGFHGSTPAEDRPNAKASLQQWRALWEKS